MTGSLRTTSYFYENVLRTIHVDWKRVWDLDYSSVHLGTGLLSLGVQVNPGLEILH